MSMVTILAIGVLSHTTVNALLIVAHLRLRHRHRRLRKALHRVAGERDAARLVMPAIFRGDHA